jgi:hypothetical protein
MITSLADDPRWIVRRLRTDVGPVREIVTPVREIVTPVREIVTPVRDRDQGGGTAQVPAAVTMAC